MFFKIFIVIIYTIFSSIISIFFIKNIIKKENTDGVLKKLNKKVICIYTLSIFLFLIVTTFNLNLFQLNNICIFISLVGIIAIVDLYSWEIPDVITAPLLIIAYIYSYLDGNLVESIGKSLYFIFPFLIIYFYSELFTEKDIFGLGDIKLLLVIGTYFNRKINLFSSGIFFLVMCTTAIIYYIIYKIIKKENAKEQGIPLGPFLALAVNVFIFI